MIGRGRNITRVCGQGRRPYIPSSSNTQVPSPGINTLSNLHTSPSSPTHSPNPYLGHSSMPLSTHPQMSHVPYSMPPHSHSHVLPPYLSYPG